MRYYRHDRLDKTLYIKYLGVAQFGRAPAFENSNLINKYMEESIMLICKHCDKECKNKNSLRNHERLCKENPEPEVLDEIIQRVC